MRTSGCWRRRFPPPVMSPRCLRLAHPPDVCCDSTRRRHSRRLRWRRRRRGRGSPSPTSSLAFALVGDVESCLAMRYEALVLRDAKYSDDLDLHVSHEEWLTFAKDSLDNGFYAIASKAFANALVHIHPGHPGYLDSTNSILKNEDQ